MKTVYNESFVTFDEAQYYMEVRLARHNNMFIHEAKLHYVNGNWNVGLLFSENQLELDIDE